MSKKTSSFKIRKLLTSATAVGAISLTMAAAPAMAFVDKSHSAQGVQSSATMYTGQPTPSGGFIDHDHTAASGPKQSNKIDGYTKAGQCGFIDCSHKG